MNHNNNNMPHVDSPEAEDLLNNEERRASYPYPGTVRTSLSIGDQNGFRRHFYKETDIQTQSQGRTRSASSSFSSATAPTPRSSSLSTISFVSISNEKYELQHLEDNHNSTHDNNHSRRSSLSILEEKKHARKKPRRSKNSEYGRSSSRDRSRLSISGIYPAIQEHDSQSESRSPSGG